MATHASSSTSGCPRPGTTYLQTPALGQRGRAAPSRACCCPARRCREHLWASGVVREDPQLDRRGPGGRRGLGPDRRRRSNAWPGTAMISHEFFAGRERRAGRARRMRATSTAPRCTWWSPPATPLSLVTARWQEFVKNGSTVPDRRLPGRARRPPPARVGLGHARPRRRAAPLGQRPAARAGARDHAARSRARAARRAVAPVRAAARASTRHACDTSGTVQNESLGVVEVELLRRVNADLDGLHAADRPRQLDPRLPRAGQARAARRREVLAVRRPGRRAPRPAATGLADDLVARGVRRDRRRRGPPDPADAAAAPAPRRRSPTPSCVDGGAAHDRRR